MYTAIVLDPEDSSKLIKNYKDLLPRGLDYIAHHVTLHLGPPRRHLQEIVGTRVSVRCVSIGKSDKAVALGVELPDGVVSDNSVPHITIAVNREAGGKPKDSNNITQWESITPFELTGTITLC